MIRKLFVLTLACAATLSVAAQTASFSLHNPNKVAVDQAPVTVPLADINMTGAVNVKVSVAGQEVLAQMDDMDGDGTPDELFFMVSLTPGETKTVVLNAVPKSKKKLIPRTYAEMAVMKQTFDDTQYIGLSDLTVNGSEQAYKVLANGGGAIETDMVGYLIRFDKSYAVSLFGKSRRTLELHSTHNRPDSIQQSMGYGSVVVDGYENMGLGSLRPWDGTAPDYFTMASKRRMRVVTVGPLRTVLEVYTYGWEPKNTEKRVNVMQRFTVYAGHRHCRVDVLTSDSEYALCTGMKALTGGKLLADRSGLRASWGSADGGMETLGMALYMPQLSEGDDVRVGEDFIYPLPVQAGAVTYYISFCCGREKKPFASADDWFAYTKQWRNQLALLPIEVK